MFQKKNSLCPNPLDCDIFGVTISTETRAVGFRVFPGTSERGEKPAIRGHYSKKTTPFVTGDNSFRNGQTYPDDNPI